MQATFFPTARQTNWLLIVGFLAIGQALYLRYLAIEYAPVSLACQGGLQSWLAARGVRRYRKTRAKESTATGNR